MNLEKGLKLEPRFLQKGKTRRQQSELQKEYNQVSGALKARERKAKERVLEYVDETSWTELLGEQARKLRLLVFESPSFFERALGKNERWGPDPPSWLKTLERPARWMWFAILFLGLAGCLAQGLRGPGWWIHALLVLYFAAALLVIPYKLRFAMPLVPTLCLFTGGLLQWIADRWRSKHAP